MINTVNILLFYRGPYQKQPNGRVLRILASVPGLNPAGDGIQPMTVRRFFVQSLSLSPSRHLDMTQTMLKGTKNTKSYSGSPKKTQQVNTDHSITLRTDMVLVYCCVLTLPSERTGLSIFVFKSEKRLFFHRLMSQLGRAKRKFFSSMPKCTDSYHPAHAQSSIPVLSNDY